MVTDLKVNIRRVLDLRIARYSCALLFVMLQ